MRVLVTGGAGFIGSHVCDLLLRRGCDVVALDPLDPQVHPDRRRPAYLDPRVRLVEGDVRDRARLLEAMKDARAVVHLAARVGVGQSMYEAAAYTDANATGTAAVLEAVVTQTGGRTDRSRSVRRVVVASSMSIYGEGAYRCASCGTFEGRPRPAEHLDKRLWEMPCPRCGHDAAPVPTPETKTLEAESVYALSKKYAEEVALVMGRAYGIPVVALRFFNVYGPRQSLANPYTGVAAIFASRLLAGRPPLVFEDGRQSRDFVHVRDVARAVVRSIEDDAPAGIAVNVGTGRPTTVLEVAEALGRALGRAIEPEVTGRFRAGDVRHCYAETDLARNVLEWSAEVPFGDGVGELAEWIASGAAGHEDRVDAATEELARHGLVR